MTVSNVFGCGPGCGSGCGCNSASVLTDKILGSNYITVRNVAQNMNNINLLAADIEALNRLVESITNVDELAAAMTTLQTLHDELGNLTAIQDVISSIEAYPTRLTATNTIIADYTQKITINGYMSIGDCSPVVYQRVAVQPIHGGKFRSLDRYLPNGSIDATNGGWWEMVLSDPDLILSPKHFGAPNNGVDHDDVALRALVTVLQLKICKRAAFKGQYKIYPAGVKPVDLFVFVDTPGLIFSFVDVTFTCVVPQTALFADANWAANTFYFLNCKNFRAIGRPKFVGDLTFAQLQIFSSAYGLIGFQFYGNCSGVTMDGIDAEGILCPSYIVFDESTVKVDSVKPVVAVGGAGYTTGDVVSLPGTGSSTAAVYTVDSVTGGVVNGISLFTLGNYPSGTLPVIGTGNGYAFTGGTGTGLRAYVYMQRADDTQHTSGGNMGFVRARNCFYGYVQRDSGDNITAYVDAERCFRATFAYGGIIGAKIYTTMKHIYRTAVIMGSAFHGLGNRDCYFKITMKQADEASMSVGDCICRPSFDTAHPSRVSLHVDIDLDYGSFSARAANFMEISKYNLGVYDNLPRGHDLKLKVTGRIKGKSAVGSASAFGTHISMEGWTWTGDQFGGWEIGPLEIEGGGDIIIDPRAFPGVNSEVSFPNTKSGIHFDVVNPDGLLTFNNGFAGTAYRDVTLSRCAVSVSPRSNFKNRYGSFGATVATIGCIDTTSNITLSRGWHNFVIKAGGGTGGVVVRDLPVSPYEGLRYEIQNLGTSVGTIVRVFPPNTDSAFQGNAIGKYLDLVVGACVTLECVQTVADNGINTWALVSTNGSTLTYQA